MSALESEVNGDGTTSVSMFGRDWSVPLVQRLEHKLGIQAGMNARFVDEDLVICQVFLSSEDFAALVKLNPTDAELDAFSTKIAQAIGTGDKGNSSPSSASS